MNTIKDLYKLEMNGKTIISSLQNEEKVRDIEHLSQKQTVKMRKSESKFLKKMNNLCK
jgi:hypothetical protein